MNFNYMILWQHPYSLLAYSSLSLCMILFYFNKHPLFRVVLFTLVIFFGWWAGRIEWIAIPLIVLFAWVFYCGMQAKTKTWRILASVATLVMAITIMFVNVPGIHNWQVVSKMSLTPDAIPYSMRFTFDKSLIGLFFLWFSPYSLANQGQWKGVLKIGFLTGILAIGILIPLSYALGYVRFEPKITSFFFLWAIHNLLFVSIAEEALFRGMIQKPLMLKWQNVAYGPWAALVITALFFGGAHYAGGTKYILLATIAGLLYGYAFMRAKMIEASILTHFMVNSAHFLFFTYPALRSAF